MKRYTATFSNGETVTRTSEHEYVTAWIMFGPSGLKHAHGFSASLNPRGEYPYRQHKMNSPKTNAEIKEKIAQCRLEVVPAVRIS